MSHGIVTYLHDAFILLQPLVGQLLRNFLIENTETRDQPKNKENAMRQLRSILYDKDLLQLEEFAKYGEVYTTTEDGSHGEKGYVTQHSILNKVRFEQIYTCGPKPMMVAVAKYAKSNQIECEVSLENTMACGIGACLCCVENTTEGHLCVCKEGPVFNINKLLWQI